MNRRFEDFLWVAAVFLLIMSLIVILSHVASAETFTAYLYKPLKVGDCYKMKTVTGIIDRRTYEYTPGCNLSWMQPQNTPSNGATGTLAIFRKKPLKVGECYKGKTIIEVIDRKTYRYVNGCSNCQIVIGKGFRNIFIEKSQYKSDDEMHDLGKWIYDKMKNREPYDEVDYTVYFEKYPDACAITRYKSDVKFMVDKIPGGYVGWGVPYRKGEIRSVTFDPGAHWWKHEFLLFHELGHAYGLGHDPNKTIMNRAHVSDEYAQWQIDFIRNQIND
jgi:hypothetical protein